MYYWLALVTCVKSIELKNDLCYCILHSKLHRSERALTVEKYTWFLYPGDQVNDLKTNSQNMVKKWKLFVHQCGQTSLFFTSDVQGDSILSADHLLPV